MLLGKSALVVGSISTEAMSRTTFQVDDWLIHTPKSILAKNFGVDVSVFNTLPESDPYILPPTSISTADVSDPYGETDFIYRLSKITPPTVPGGGGTLSIIDSRVFPIATTIAAAVVRLEPGGLRELHWHPNVGGHLSTSSAQKAERYIC